MKKTLLTLSTIIFVMTTTEGQEGGIAYQCAGFSEAEFAELEGKLASLLRQKSGQR